MRNLTELKRLQWNRDYFEKGCKCIHDGKLKKLQPSVDNRFAVHFYEQTCNCSRNYVHSKGFQDNNLLRGTGRTTRAIENAPRDTVLVVTRGAYHEARQICHEYGRRDITIIGLSDLVNQFMGRFFKDRPFVFDHYVFESVTGQELKRLISFLQQDLNNVAFVDFTDSQDNEEQSCTLK